MRIRRFSRMRLRMVAIAWVISESFSGSTALAQLDGGVVAAGAATISQQGSVTNVMQTTDRAVINWNNFSVPNGHTANFNMPSVNSAVLNRVTSLNNPSLINGAINSNGNVFLVNPSGVIVGSTGVINTAGFTASALDLPNSEFMKGGTLHFRGDSKASIVNNGTINTGAGGVALVGHTVINTGTITSQGSISLVSGGSVKLSNGGTYTQADLATINNGISETAGLIKNTGTIRAVGSVNSGGEVYLVNPNGKILHSGVIRATRATTVAAAPGAPTTTKIAGGKVQIEARSVTGSGGTVEISGTVDVSGDVGGKVSITGSAVQLASATIDASGESAGGVVQLGGGYQGKDTSITNALATSVDAASTISVNAATGNAGTVIVWSDQATEMAGTITAQSTVSGDGGLIEISSHGLLGFSGVVALSSANGAAGTVLFDPTNIIIGASGANNNQLTDPPSPGEILVGEGGPNSNITALALTTALASGNVVLQASNDITFNSYVEYTQANSLTVMAGHDIVFNAGLQNKGSGDINLVAGWDQSTPIGSFSSISGVNLSAAQPFGAGNGSVRLNSATGTAGVAVGSAGGATNVYGYDLIIQAANNNDEYAQLGYHNIAATGQVTPTGAINAALLGKIDARGGTGFRAYAQIGHGGTRGESGGTSNAVNYGGNILLKALGNITAAAGSNNNSTTAQIGHGGNAANGNHSGTITIAQANDVSILGGTSFQAYAQIGHGGNLATGNISDAILLQNLSGQLLLQAGSSNNNTNARLGHGGISWNGNLSGNITINQITGDVSVLGGNAFEAIAQLGHGGQSSNSNTVSGNIAITNARDVIVRAVTSSQNNATAQLGHGSIYGVGNINGSSDIQITSVRNVTVATASAFQSSALLGHAGSATVNGLSGAIEIQQSGNLSIQGNPSNNFARIGHYKNANNATTVAGNIALRVGTNATLTNGNIGHFAQNAANLTIGYTYIGVGQNAPGMTGAGNLVANAGSRISSATGAQLRLYVPENSAYQLATGVFLNGVATTSASPSNLMGYANFGNGTPHTPPGQLYGVYLGQRIIYVTATGSSVYGTDPTLNLGSVTYTITNPGVLYNPADAATLATQFTSGNLTVTSSTGVGTYVNSFDIGLANNSSQPYQLVPNSSTTGTWSVTPATLVLAASNQTKVYGNTLDLAALGMTQGAGPTGGFTVVSGLVTSNGDNVDSVTLTASGVPFNGDQAQANAGNYTLTASAAQGTGIGNYTINYLTGSLDVTPTPITLTAVSIGLQYGSGFNFSGTQFSQTGGTFYNGDTLASVTMGADAFGGGNLPATANVGAYTISIVPGSEVFSTGLASNYAFTYNPGVFTVNAAPLTVSIPGITKTYGSVIDVNSSAVVSGYVFPADVGSATPNFTSAGEASTANVVGGPYAITGSLLTNSNYYYDSVNSSIGQVTVTPAPITLRAVSFGLTYGAGFNFTGTQFATVGGNYYNNDTLASVTMGADDYGGGNLPFNAPVGPYGVSIVPGSEVFSIGSASNYAFTYQPGVITVSPAALTITANNQNKIYGDTLNLAALGNTQGPAPAGGFTVSGLVSGDSVTSVTLTSAGAVDTATVGDYSIDVTPLSEVGSGLSNYTISYASGTLAVGQRDITVTALGGTSVYGSNPANPGLSATNLASFDTVNNLTGLSNSFGIDGTDWVNTYAMNVIGALANPNYNVTQYISQTWSVTPAPLELTAVSFVLPYGTQFNFNGGQQYAVTGGTQLYNNDALSVAFQVSGTPAGNTAQANVGNYTITIVSGSENFTVGSANNYNITYKTGVLGKSPVDLLITANNQSKIYGNALDLAALGMTQGPAPTGGFTVTGLVANGNGDAVTSVTLASAGAVDTATVVGNPYSIVASAATGPGLSNYTISYVDGTVTVTPRDITVTAVGGSSTYGQNPLNPGLSATNLASFDAADPNGVLTGLSNSFGITQYTNAGPHTLTVVGTLTNPNYNVTDRIDGNWIVNQAALTVTADNRTKTYGQTLILGTTQFTPVGLQNGETIGSVTLASAGAAGSATVAGSPYAITTSNATGGTFNPNNYTITYSAAGLLTVNKADLIVTANNRNKTYGDNLNLGTTAFTRTGPLFNGNTLTNVTLVASGTPAGNTAAADAGTYAITPSNAVGSGLDNYNITYVNGTLNVGRANLFITPTSQTKVYGDSFTFNGTEFNSAGLKNGDIIASVTLVSAGTAPTANAGLYGITASNAVGGTYKASNYNTFYIPNLFGFTVTRAPLTVDINDATKVYGDVKTFNGTEFTVSGLKNTDTLTNVTILSAGQLAIAPVGNYAIIGTVPVQGNINLLNYNITVNPGTLSVTPAPLTVTATDQTKIYGNTFTFTGNSPEFNASGLKNGQQISSVTIGSAGAPATATVGNYDIDISNAQGFGFNPNNYSITYVKGDFEVTARALTITASDQSKIYGQAGFALGTTAFTTSGAPSGGLVNGDTVTNVTLTSTGEPVTAPVGSYDIFASNATGTGLSNYTIVYEKGTLDVTSRTITVTANDQSKIYGQAGFALGTTAFSVASVSGNTGLVNGDTVTNVKLTSTGEPVTAPVGSYDIFASNATGSGLSNYTIVYEKGTLDVTVRSLTIKADDQSKIFGTNHNLGTTAFTVAPISGNTGLVNGDTVTNVALTSAGTPAAAPAGTYPIVASNAAGSGLSNYSITYEDGTLFVGQANLILVANNQYKTFGWTGFLNGVTGFTPIGLQNGDTIGSVSLSSAATPNTAPIGFYPINISNPTGGTANLANYSITFVPGIFVVGSNFGNYTYDLFDQGKYYWQTLPWLYGNSGSGGGINYSPAGKTTGDKPITETNSYDVFGGEQ